MKFYTAGLLSEEEKLLLHKVRRVVSIMSDDLDLGVDRYGTRFIYSCHILARAVATVFSLRLVDGTYSSFKSEHSWVATPEDNYIDVYPIGVYSGPEDGPVFICMMTGSSQRANYVPSAGESLKNTLHDRFGREEFENAALLATNHLRTLFEIDQGLLL